MENFEETQKTENEKEIEEVLGNQGNAVNYETDFIRFHKGEIKKARKKIEEIIEKSKKIKEETDKLFSEKKKD